VRSPVYPDPLADEGKQTFTYALLPHRTENAWKLIRAEADDLNQPLLAYETTNLAHDDVISIWTPGGIGAALSTLKAAEDGDGLILRVYEPIGARGDLELKLRTGWSLGEAVNILEEAMERAPGPALRPFEIRSWRLRRD
jgi:alpha-mannosidase